MHISPVRVPGLVSIVVANYNCSRFVREALDSLVEQTYTNIEIILVDDASTDGSNEVVEEWRKALGSKLSQERFIHLRLPRNVKQSGAITAGLFMARGEFVTFLSADDLSHPERIEKQVSYFNKKPDVEMLGTSYAWFTDGDFDNVHTVDWLAFDREEIRRRYEQKQHCMCDGTIMIRGAVFDRLGGWNRRWESVSDYEFILRYMQNHVVAEALPEVLYFYRNHSGQTTQKLAQGEYRAFQRTSGLVSIVLTTYNRGHYINDALNSLKQQTYHNKEIIVVDDGSIDGTRERVEQWLTESAPLYGSGKLVMVKLPRPIGYAGAMTLGFFLAKGEFIAVHDANAISEPTRIERQVQFLEQNPDTHVLGTNFKVFSNDQIQLTLPVHWLTFGPGVMEMYKIGRHCVSLPTLMLRGDVFDNVGGLNRRELNMEARAFIVECIAQGYKVNNLPDILYYARLDKGQRSLRN